MKKKPIYKKWWVWLIAVIVFAWIGNSQSPSDTSTNNVKTTASTPKQESKPVSTAVKKDTNQQPNKDQQEAADLKKYFDENMSDSSWYPLIKVIDVSNDNVFIRTSAPVDGKDEVKGMNNAVWGYTNQNGSKYKIKSVTIYAENGHPLISEDNPKQ